MSKLTKYDPQVVEVLLALRQITRRTHMCACHASGSDLWQTERYWDWFVVFDVFIVFGIKMIFTHQTVWTEFTFNYFSYQPTVQIWSHKHNNCMIGLFFHCLCVRMQVKKHACTHFQSLRICFRRHRWSLRIFNVTSVSYGKIWMVRCGHAQSK